MPLLRPHDTLLPHFRANRGVYETEAGSDDPGTAVDILTRAYPGDRQDADVSRLRTYAERRAALKNGAAAFDRADYAVAAEQLKLAQEGSGTLTPDETRRAAHLQCISLLRIDGEPIATVDACRTARKFGYGDEVDDPLEKKFSVAVDQLTLTDPEHADAWVAAYRDLPNADSKRLARYEARLTAHREKKERDRARAKLRSDEERVAAGAAARAKLREQYRLITNLTEQQFIAAARLEQTVMGTPLFTDVQIRQGTQLVLGIPNGDYFSPNIHAFAEWNDMFSAWCNCDGETVVALDLRVAGMGLNPIMFYKLNPFSGRSQMVDPNRHREN